MGLASEPLLAAAAAAASKTPAAAAAAAAAAPPPSVDALVGASAQQVKRCVLTLAADDFDVGAAAAPWSRLCCAACYSRHPAASLEPLLRGLLAALQPAEPLHLGCAPRALNGLCGRAPPASVAPAAEALARPLRLLLLPGSPRTARS